MAPIRRSTRERWAKGEKPKPIVLPKHPSEESPEPWPPKPKDLPAGIVYRPPPRPEDRPAKRVKFASMAAETEERCGRESSEETLAGSDAGSSDTLSVGSSPASSQRRGGSASDFEGDEVDRSSRDEGAMQERMRRVWDQVLRERAEGIYVKGEPVFEGLRSGVRWFLEEGVTVVGEKER